MGFNRIIKTNFFSPNLFLPGPGGRSFRSTEPGAGRPERSTGRAMECALGRVNCPVDRAVDRLKATHSRVAPVDRPESRCSLVQGPVDRAVDRKAQRPVF